MRDYDVAGLSAGQLERTRRDLHASLALARTGSPARVPILAQMAAIDAELAGRAASLRLCSCGFAADDPAWLDGHLSEHPGHHERPAPTQPRRP